MSIRKMKCPGCGLQYEVIFEGKIQRSNPQNRYFHGVVLPILSRDTGYSEIEIKDIVKSMFLKTDIVIGGKTVTVVRGSAELKTDEFEAFMDNVRRWAAETLDCYIPEPNECGG